MTITHPDIRPEDRLAEGAGRLVRNRHRTKATDPDLTGAVRIDGRLVQLRGWVIEMADTAHIRIEVSR